MPLCHRPPLHDKFERTVFSHHRRSTSRQTCQTVWQSAVTKTAWFKRQHIGCCPHVWFVTDKWELGYVLVPSLCVLFLKNHTTNGPYSSIHPQSGDNSRRISHIPHKRTRLRLLWQTTDSLHNDKLHEWNTSPNAIRFKKIRHEWDCRGM